MRLVLFPAQSVVVAAMPSVGFAMTLSVAVAVDVQELIAPVTV